MAKKSNSILPCFPPSAPRLLVEKTAGELYTNHADPIFFRALMSHNPCVGQNRKLDISDGSLLKYYPWSPWPPQRRPRPKESFCLP